MAKPISVDDKGNQKISHIKDLKKKARESKYIPHPFFKKRYFVLLRKLIGFMKASNNTYWKKRYESVIKNELNSINKFRKVDEKQERIEKYE